MNALSLESFQSHLAMLLRDQPPGSVADLTDFAVAYWNGQQVVYCFLRDDDSRHIDEEFELDDYVWNEWSSEFSAWYSDPTFTVRPEVHEWLRDAPPHDVIG